MPEDEPPIIPENPTFNWLSYSLTTEFYPELRIRRNAGLEFAQKIADWIEPENVRTEGSEWRILGGSSCDGIEIRVGKRGLSISVQSPTNVLDWYEQRFRQVLVQFKEMFEPSVALSGTAAVRCLIPINDDARSFLGGYIMLMDPNKFDIIDRPLHLLGLRLYFPPCEEAVWGVNVRVESAIYDTNCIYIESEGGWDSTVEWNGEFSNEFPSRIGVVKQFIQTRLLPYLRQPPPWSTGDNDEDND